MTVWAGARARLGLGSFTVDKAGWRAQRLSVKLLFTLALRDADAMLRVNAGQQKQRDKFAVGFGVQQLCGTDRRERGVVIGFGWHDLQQMPRRSKPPAKHLAHVHPRFQAGAQHEGADEFALQKQHVGWRR